jgi:hypothetical protein
MRDCVECSELELELEKAALEYLRVTSFGEQNDQPNNAARRKVAEVQKRFNHHKKTHKRTRESATK